MSLKRKLALSVAGVVALAGTGVAVAASSGGGHARTAVLPFNGVSNRLGVHAGAFGWGVRGPGMGFGHRGGELSAAASYLGISSSELLSDLRSGKTLAQVADATSGKSASGLIQALVAAEKQRLDAAVAAGKLTQAQEDTIVSGLQQRVTDLVNGTLRMHRGGPHGGWMGSSSGGATA